MYELLNNMLEVERCFNAFGIEFNYDGHSVCDRCEFDSKAIRQFHCRDALFLHIQPACLLRMLGKNS